MMKRTFCAAALVLFFSTFFSQPADSITRKPPLRGSFRWIIDKDMYEEGTIHNNIKTGEWLRYYKGELSGKTVYNDGLAVTEFWNYKDSLRLRYQLTPAMDSMTIYDYDLDARMVKSEKYAVDRKTFFLNYSLMTEDTIFKKTPVTKISYSYDLWAHRDDIMVVTETTAGISNVKYFSLKEKQVKLLWETNDKGDFLTGKKKDFLKEEEKSKKLLEEKNKKPTR
jgi:hypothetical protein